MYDDNMMMENEGEMMDSEMNPLLGNLTYFHVALAGLIEASLATFRYHDENENDAGEVMGTNLWKLTAEVHHYSEIAFLGILTITQLLSMFGIAGEINIMAWMYIEMAEMVLGLLIKLVTFYIINAGYDIAYDEDETADNQNMGGMTYLGARAMMFDTMV